MLKPGKCLICETHPGHRVVDTGYNLVAATVFDKLRGRKYVCSGCGEKIGKALGMITQVQVNAMKVEIAALEARNEELAGQVDITKKVAELAAYFEGGSNVAAPTVEVESAASPGGD
jgi:hypothetical protein